MFSIKKRHYKVEYEELYVLCLNYGHFSHYKDGYGENKVHNNTYVANEVTIDK